MLASQLLCPECHHASTSFESFLDLQLEIRGYTDTLEEMLEGEGARSSGRALLGQV